MSRWGARRERSRAVVAPAKPQANDEAKTGGDDVAAARRALQSGLAWLGRAQGEDGGWHSRTYGALRGGAAVTAFALYAAARAPAEVRKPLADRLEAGYRFLQPGIRKKGTVACPDGSLDFPTYASAMTLVAVERLAIDAPRDDLAQLVDYLVRAQITESRGFAADSPHLGGWDLTGPIDEPGITSGTNVSVSRFAIEALARSKEDAAAGAVRLARRWAAGCQNSSGDGGFVFTPDRASDSNKAQWSDAKQTQARSYGTATCDGLLCLTHAGAANDDRSVAAAVKWLVDRPSVEEVPGFEDLPKEVDWQNGLRLYYYAALAPALRWFPEDAASKRRGALLAQVVALQRRDGSWRNSSARMREDDPLIATCLALVALGDVAGAAEREIQNHK